MALSEYRRALDIDSTFSPANHLLASLYTRTRQFDSAAAVFRRMVAGERQSAPELRAYGYAMQGDSANAQRILVDLRQLARTRYVSPYAVACIYVALGDRSEAMRWLESAQA